MEQKSKLLPLLPAWPDEKAAESVKVSLQPAAIAPLVGVRASKN